MKKLQQKYSSSPNEVKEQAKALIRRLGNLPRQSMVEQFNSNSNFDKFIQYIEQIKDIPSRKAFGNDKATVNEGSISSIQHGVPLGVAMHGGETPDFFIWDE